jgi:hypothetical protein
LTASLKDSKSTWRAGKKEPEIMVYSFSRTFHKGPGPSRLFIGGLHGKEGETTFQALQDFDDSVLNNGKIYLYNFPPSSYISTLERRYYDTSTGREVLDLIKKIQPTIYLELHCYQEKNRSKLTHHKRKSGIGVPPLVELDKGVLIGSVSPIIRSVFFKKYDFPFILEIPCQPSPDSLQVYLEVLKIAAGSENRREILEKLELIYPSQVVKLKKHFVDFSDNFLILFEKTREFALNNDMDSNDLLHLMENLMQELDLNLNQIQLKQMQEAILIFADYKPSGV